MNFLTGKLLVVCLLCVWQGNIAGEPLVFDLASVPFSYKGSYMAVSTRTPKDIPYKQGIFIHDVSGKNMWKWNGVFRLVPLLNGKEESYTVKASPDKVVISGMNGGICEITFENKNILRVKCTGLDLQLSCLQKDFAYFFEFEPGKWLLPSFVVRSVSGSYRLTKSLEDYYSFLFSSNNHSCEFAVDFYESGWSYESNSPAFEACAEQTGNLFAQWAKNYPATIDKYAFSRDMALYVNWSCIVSPRDNMTRNGMLMSKNWMHSVWSWDNCFNALAIGETDPKLAWEQIQLMFDRQYPTGAFPDALTDHDNVWTFNKPPIYGIILQKLMDMKTITPAMIPDIYDHISRFTNFWFTYRDMNKNGIPEYFHGNDSGWDNATVFDAGFPAESADLSSFLVLQMDFLSNLATKLGKTKEAEAWKQKSDKLLQLMLSNLWVNNRFVARNILNGKANENSQSLIAYIPIILGKKLPDGYSKMIISGLKNKGHLTQYGLATENPSSSLYASDSYWRGPVWAPSTYIIVEGLKQCGEYCLAHKIAEQFCDLCVKSGFAENFDALTGQPLRDPAYTWTSSVFLIFLNDYFKKS